MSGYDNPWEKFGKRDDGYWNVDPRKFRKYPNEVFGGEAYHTMMDTYSKAREGISPPGDVTQFNNFLMKKLEGSYPDEEINKFRSLMPTGFQTISMTEDEFHDRLLKLRELIEQ